MEDAAHERDAEVGLEVRAVVPAERGDAVAGADAEAERGREASGARGEVGVGVAVPDLSAARQTISWRGKSCSARRKMVGTSAGSPSSGRRISRSPAVEEGGRDLGLAASIARGRPTILDPQSVRLYRRWSEVLPGEADAAVGPGSRARRRRLPASATLRLGGGCGDFVACGSPTAMHQAAQKRERAGELELEVGGGERMRHRLVGADLAGRTARASRRARPRTRAHGGRCRTPPGRARRGLRRRSSRHDRACRPGGGPARRRTMTPSGRVASDVSRTSRSPPSSSKIPSSPTKATLSAVSRSVTSGASASVHDASPDATSACRFL